jgi:hypothetical protein
MSIKLTMADLQRNITCLYGTGVFYTILMKLVAMAQGEAKLDIKATPSAKAMAVNDYTSAIEWGWGVLRLLRVDSFFGLVYPANGQAKSGAGSAYLYFGRTFQETFGIT